MCLDPGVVESFIKAGPSATKTPFVGIHRLPPGRTATWSNRHAEPIITTWCGPDSWAQPDVSGDDVVERYLDNFDGVIDGCVVAGEGLHAAMSGGLDSTFVVAALARHASPERPVHAYCHVPHPDARLSAQGNWDPDDLAIAQAMERRYSGVVEVIPIANLDRVQPLDAAAAISHDTLVPCLNPANAIWMDEMRRRAYEHGASYLFEGENGNAAFSYEPDFALGHHLIRREFDDARAVWRTHRATGLSRYRTARRFVARPLVYTTALRLRPPGSLSDGIGLSSKRNRPIPMNNDRYRAWLSREGGWPMWMQDQPNRAGFLDPFTASSVLDLAAAMTPREWMRYGANRGYARRLGVGRVPDEIRLRTRRGGQSWDHWFVVSGQRDRYLDEAGALATTPLLAELLGPELIGEIRAEVERWPWGDPGHGPSSLIPIERLFALASYVRSTPQRLADLGRSALT